jgi:hypothetical protein
MTRILLTGAGFSRNWGGWLASEAFEYLLGCTEIDQETRRLLWRTKESGGGFEDTLADLASAKDAQGKKRYDDLTAALVGMFNAMTQGFMQRQFEFQNDVRYLVATFLAQFDAIFTLNQDTLLELHYLGYITGGKYGACRIPGVKPLSSAASGTLHDKIAPQQPDQANFKLASNIQPYIKLHGSCNWNDGTSSDRILIMGGQKAINIDQFSILSWYHREFRQFLSQPDARLMVIGYSFSDAHINKAIEDGVEKGLKLFIIGPRGVDALDKRQKEPLGRERDEYMDKLTPNIIGASRRPLTSIFFDDVVEHGRVMKFFT